MTFRTLFIHRLQIPEWHLLSKESRMKNIITTDGLYPCGWRRNGRWKYDEAVSGPERWHSGTESIRSDAECGKTWLVFDENYSSEVIFKLSESQNASVSRHTIQSLTGRHLGTIRYCHTQTGQYGRLPTRLYWQMDIPSVFQTIL